MKPIIPRAIPVPSPVPVRANNYSPLHANDPPLPNNHSSVQLDNDPPAPNNDPPLPVRTRRSVRLRGYDYSQAGAYFITICTQNRHCLFGNITDGAMVLNDAGRAAADCWLQIPDHFPHVELDEWVVMPNHIHGIVIIVGANNHSPVPSNNHLPIQSNHDSPPPANPPHPTGTARTIGSMVRGFKIGVTQWYRQRSVPSKIWQRNYWDHIIRNELELNRIRQYILDNPMQWEQDSLHAPTGVGANNDSPLPTSPAYALEPWLI